MFPVEAVALWVDRKPNKELDLGMKGSQEILFWYERTIISLQFFINLICRKFPCSYLGKIHLNSEVLPTD